MEKQCFKCGLLKPLSMFYRHKAMGDGHLNKCIECAKEDTKRRISTLKSDNQWVESERKRGREKYRRLYVGKNSKNRASYNLKYFEKYPEKKFAKTRAGKLKRPSKGVEGHHWSYNEEHYEDVIWMTKKDHMKGHRFIIYDQERMMYRRCDNNVLLDTKDLHLQYITWCIKTKED